MKKEPTPLERLTANKEKIQVLSKIQENKMNANVQYLHQNGGKLLLSGIVSAILPGGKSSSPSSITGLALGGGLDYFTRGKHLFPLVLSVAQPFLLTWGVKEAKKLVANLLSGNKKGKK